MRALVEEGLRLVMQQRQNNPSQTFKLRDAHFDGGQNIWPESQEWRELETQHLMASMRLPDAQKPPKPKAP